MLQLSDDDAKQLGELGRELYIMPEHRHILSDAVLISAGRALFKRAIEIVKAKTN